MRVNCDFSNRNKEGRRGKEKNVLEWNFQRQFFFYSTSCWPVFFIFGTKVKVPEERVVVFLKIFRTVRNEIWKLWKGSQNSFFRPANWKKFTLVMKNIIHLPTKCFQMFWRSGLPLKLSHAHFLYFRPNWAIFKCYKRITNSKNLKKFCKVWSTPKNTEKFRFRISCQYL